MRDSLQVPLIVHIVYRLDFGGLENGLVNIVNHMPESEFRHAIVCLAGYSDFHKRIRRGDVELYSLDKRPGKDFGMYVRLWRLLRRLQPVIVHTRNLGAVDLQWVALASNVAGRVHGEHGWEASDPWGMNAKHRLIRRACRPAIRHYIAMSRDLARWLHTEIRIPEGKIAQIYNGVDVERFTPANERVGDAPWSVPAERPFVFGTVGRLDPVKRQSALLEAFSRLVTERPQSARPIRLIVVGGGPLRDQLLERAKALGVANAVWFTGPRSDVPALMRSMDVFVLPSMNEGISNTILEAMASGLPVVAARVGGNPELVGDGETGTLYDDRSVDGLVRAMRQYVERPDLVRRQGISGRERAVTDFSLDSMVNSYLNVYRGLCAIRTSAVSRSI